MSRQRPCSCTFHTLVGSILVAAGLFVLFGHLVGAASQWKGLLHSMGEGLGVLSSVILASSLNYQQLVHDLLRVFWPLFPVTAGSVLLRNASHPPCRGSRQMAVRRAA